MQKTKLAVHGALGRMGQAVIRAAMQRAECEIVAALVHPDAPQNQEPLSAVFGKHAPPVDFSSVFDAETKADALIDFTDLGGFDAGLALARERGLAFVTGTTGLSARQFEALQAAAAQIPVLWASNFSIGVALLRRLAAEAAQALGEQFDVEIVEAHHRQKQDAPSGTALTLGREIAAARNRNFDDIAQYARHGASGPRKPGDIGFAVIRAADIIGEHSVLFIAPGERIELAHRANDRGIFAQGAVRSAIWLARQPPGIYDIVHVLRT